MSPLNLLMVLAYWAFLLGAVLVAGSFTTRALVTIPSGADVCIPGGGRKCLGESAARFVFFFSILALFACVVHFILHASVVTETPLGEVSRVILPFLTKTKFGRLTLIRLVLFVGVILSALYSTKRMDRKAEVPGMVFSLAVLVTMSMSGHQGAKGYLTVPFFLDVFHTVAVVVWIGGLFFIRLCYSFLLRTAGSELWDNFYSLIRRFSSSATWGVLVVMATGASMAVWHMKSFSMFVTTPYGITLGIKIVLACVIAMLGGVNKFFVIPMLSVAGKTGPGRLDFLKRTLYVLVTMEMVFGFLVLLATSFLTHLSPEGI
jgi:putative copper resistance protein D